MVLKLASFTSSFRIDAPRSNSAFQVRFLLFMLLITGLAICLPLRGQCQGLKNVLIINSYHSHYFWTQETLRGIESVVNESTFDVEIYLEYMDSRRHPSEKLEPILYDLFQQKASKIQTDIIIASDNFALDFILKYRDELFPGIPVIFCGVNNFETAMLEGQNDITGVIERSDIIGTLELALKLQPDKRRVYVIDDQVHHQSPARDRFENEIIPHFADRLEFDYLSDISMDELLNAVANIPDDGLIYLSSFFIDRDGRYIEENELRRQLVKHASAPIYTSFDFYLADGVLGGIITSGYEQGRVAATMAEEVLNGALIETVPIQRSSPNVCKLDDLALRKFGIDQSSLPPGCVIINSPEPPLYVKYADYIVAALTINLILTGLVVILISTIAKRRKIETQLRESENRLRVVLQTMPAMVLAFDDDERIINWNHECERVSGYPADEIIGAGNALDMLFPEPDEREKAAQVLMNPTGQHRGVEVALRRKDQSSCVTAWSNLSRLYPIAGWRAWAIGIDISERKQMEEELLRTRKLESVGILAGGIAHDFNNLLTAVVGNLSLAKEELEVGGFSHQRLNEAEKASFRAKDLTLQLLTFAKGGAPVKKTAEIQSFVKETALFTLRGSNVRCEFEFSDGLFLVDVDAGQMSQVVQNLVINANQAMPDGGVITVRLNNVRLEPGLNQPASLPPGDYVCLSIQDEGEGIPKEILDQIFDPYFTTKPDGNGLGLATVYSIIHKHGGVITAQSAVGEGSTFTIYLPASKRQSHLNAPLADASVYVGTGRLLVMDDEEVVRRVLKDMLEQIGFSVDLARDGNEAVAMYKDAYEAGRSYRGVILDLTVPGGMGGGEAIKQIRSIDPQVNAVVSSGYSNDPVMADYEQHGFCGTIGKPYEMDDLRSVMQQAFG